MKKIILSSVLTSAFLLVSVSLSSAEVKKSEENKNIVQKTFGMPGDILKAVAGPASKKAGAKTDKPVKVKTDKPAKPGESTDTTKAAKNENAAKDEDKAKAATDSQLREHIEELLDYESEATAGIPNLKKVDKVYIYEGKPLKDISREKLDKLYVSVMNEIGRIRAERLNRQTQQIAQAARASATRHQAAQVPVVPTPPPQPPKVMQPPPAPPSAQPQVYNPPRPPAPPPAPPRR